MDFLIYILTFLFPVPLCCTFQREEASQAHQALPQVIGSPLVLIQEHLPDATLFSLCHLYPLILTLFGCALIPWEEQKLGGWGFTSA